jgi:hypothetical protein
MGAGGGRTARMLRKMDEERNAGPAKKAEKESDVFIWPSGGEYGERTGEDWSGSFGGTAKAKKENDKKYPRKKGL